MLAAERCEKIVQLVDERGSVRVSELSEIFKVTEETIRRDLDKLEQAGRLLRSHGGAVSIKDHTSETPFMEREVTNVEEKKQIAKEAVRHVRPRDRIILDASTTAWYMAQMLPDIPLTVLTNSIKVAFELANKEKIEVVSTGGILSPRSLSFVGPLAESSLEQYHVNKAFISCKGVHLDRGATESNELQARLKKRMIEIADEVYLLVDYSKFNVNEFSQAAPCEAFHTLITDAKAEQRFLAAWRERYAANVIVAGT
ncbi:putative HTH-type transcriptional regulator YulB [Insulibacter thermoxylanivorax]|uniref:HTH-type transcriptional regulator YulB n=1 Tax=Insulibacter thermoxylanivorax TaxID=2749268 RepID=A0A916QHA0_9BACL|nr:DeoR/GlpR family DNA-binding transcription regulator [Insulibacter thermoxylanivorax]GFR38367.1 putative HTH-type transcriptional regulator YulB [Insulibacter thermoxylanivorax]